MQRALSGMCLAVYSLGAKGDILWRQAGSRASRSKTEEPAHCERNAGEIFRRKLKISHLPELFFPLWSPGWYLYILYFDHNSYLNNQTYASSTSHASELDFKRNIKSQWMLRAEIPKFHRFLSKFRNIEHFTSLSSEIRVIWWWSY